jgi:Ca2+-binding RTX toxin-like protein
MPGTNVLAGLGGADTLDGGAGTDTATYAASPAGVNISLATGLAIGGDAAGDTLINFENLTGSAFNDTLEGNGGNNVLVGGASIDTLSYEHAASGMTISLATTAAQNTGGAGTDTVSSFENSRARGWATS